MNTCLSIFGGKKTQALSGIRFYMLFAVLLMIKLGLGFIICLHPCNWSLIVSLLRALVRGSTPLCCRVEIVQKRDRETLTEVIKRNIKLGSRIISVGWGAYCPLAEE